MNPEETRPQAFESPRETEARTRRIAAEVARGLGEPHAQEVERAVVARGVGLAAVFSRSHSQIESEIDQILDGILDDVQEEGEA
jgi:hypothetical protein